MPKPSSCDAAPGPDAGQNLEGLVYVSDDAPGISRRLVRNHFQYFDAEGRRIRDDATVARIRTLAIPPAYHDVWICPDPRGHVQATGRDDRGRKQYRYHPRWQALRDAAKYDQLVEFADALPRIRRQVERDMARRGVEQEKVVAVVVRLLELTLVRVGTRQYARDNKSYGLTTLRRRHTMVAGDRIRFRFKGKSGVEHDVTVSDRRIARIVRRCMEIPGHELFTYRDADGIVRRVDSGQVNHYLKQASGSDFTAKHYRTWAGSVFVMAKLQAIPWESATQAKRVVVEVVKEAAQRLGNTPAVCRNCYIHPAVIDAYLEGRLPPKRAMPDGKRGLSADERRLVAFLVDPTGRR